MQGSLRIGKIAGIEIDIHYSWLIIFVLLTTSLAVSWFPTSAPSRSTLAYWIAGGVAAVLLFVSVLLHELAHSLLAKSRGMPVKSITLFIFGGVSNLEQEPENPGTEFWMALVGPLTSLAIGGISALLMVALSGTDKLVVAVLGYLALTNVLLGVFNMIPGFPLDGGRVLRSILWRISGDMSRATRWAASVGQFIAYIFILAGIWLFFTISPLDGLWIGFIGWFLLQAARGEEQQVRIEQESRGVYVFNVMQPPPPTCAPGTTIREFVDEQVLRSGQRASPVVADGQLVGLVTLKDVLRVPRDQWGLLSVARVMIPASQLITVEAHEPLYAALKRVMSAEVSQVPVVDNGNLVGLINVESALRWLQLRREIEPPARPLANAS